MGIYIATGVLVVILGAATALLFLLGLLGVSGVVRFVRCPSCERFVVFDRGESDHVCPYCRHERLVHPLAFRRARRGLQHH